MPPLAEASKPKAALTPVVASPTKPSAGDAAAVAPLLERPPSPARSPQPTPALGAATPPTLPAETSPAAARTRTPTPTRHGQPPSPASSSSSSRRRPVERLFDHVNYDLLPRLWSDATSPASSPPSPAPRQPRAKAPTQPAPVTLAAGPRPTAPPAAAVRTVEEVVRIEPTPHPAMVTAASRSSSRSTAMVVIRTTTTTTTHVHMVPPPLPLTSRPRLVLGTVGCSVVSSNGCAMITFDPRHHDMLVWQNQEQRARQVDQPLNCLMMMMMVTTMVTSTVVAVVMMRRTRVVTRWRR